MSGDREPLGRIVHEQRLALNAELEHPRGLLPWEQRAPMQQELDMRIGSAVAAQAVRDAGLENERMRMQLFAIGTALPAARRALVIAITGAEYEADAKPFRRALEIFGGEDGPAQPEPALPVAADPVLPGEVPLPFPEAT